MRSRPPSLSLSIMYHDTLTLHLPFHSLSIVRLAALLLALIDTFLTLGPPTFLAYTLTPSLILIQRRSQSLEGLFLAYISLLPSCDERNHVSFIVAPRHSPHCACSIDSTKENGSTQVMRPHSTFCLHHRQQYYLAIEYLAYDFQQFGGLSHESRVFLKEAAANSASLGWPGSYPLASI